ncbi:MULTISPECIES: hypothetical protein [Nocardiopsis]|uniref:Uncharacterized protein n=1 Tax=Nocardiopsis sinuspersici TaxID=501010 RepID=A0A1V3C1D7_9ACTN|nr:MULTISPECIES: hypothetical protein [Nocardiopsis]OOC54316.1 hypothetical protein NOSIN_11290 [Nocardiopsis sinuspersici]
MRFLLAVLLPSAVAGLALSRAVPWFEDGCGHGLAVHVPVVALTAVLLFLWAGERARSRGRSRHGERVTAVVAGVEPLPAEAVPFPGHTVTLEFTGLDGRRRRTRDTSGLGGYVLKPGARVFGRSTPQDPGRLEVVEVVGAGGRRPVTGPGHRP